MDIFARPKFTIPVLYGTIGMVFYLWVTVTLIVERKILKSSFYKLFIAGFVMNLLTYTNSFFSLRFPQNTGIDDTFAVYYVHHDVTNHESRCPINIFHFLHYQFAYAQYIFNSLICTNRFTLIFFPFYSEKFWKNYLWAPVLLMFLAPTPATIWILIGTSYYRYSTTGDYFWIDSTYGRGNIYKVLTPVLSGITVLNIVLNVCSYVKMRKVAKEGYNVPERSLLRMSFCVFFIDSFLTILAILNAVLTIWNPENPNLAVLAKWVSSLTPFASDILTLTPPILLFIFSKLVRRKCIELIPFLRQFRRHPYFANSMSIAFVRRFGETTY